MKTLSKINSDNFIEGIFQVFKFVVYTMSVLITSIKVEDVSISVKHNYNNTPLLVIFTCV